MRFYIPAVILLATAAMLLVSYRLSRCTFTCRTCGKSFRIRWRRALWVQHYNREYILRCPHCGNKGWCAARPPEPHHVSAPASPAGPSASAPASSQRGEP